jgi:hypothetical protein
MHNKQADYVWSKEEYRYLKAMLTTKEEIPESNCNKFFAKVTCYSQSQHLSSTFANNVSLKELLFKCCFF